LQITPIKAASYPTVSLHDSKSIREEALLSYQILGTATEKAFDEIAALASSFCQSARPIT
jgi:hypothetical protein